jgi:heme/copper-type cytochrome/quinol oxidase subunit 1
MRVIGLVIGILLFVFSLFKYAEARNTLYRHESTRSHFQLTYRQVQLLTAQLELWQILMIIGGVIAGIGVILMIIGVFIKAYNNKIIKSNEK